MQQVTLSNELVHISETKIKPNVLIKTIKL